MIHPRTKPASSRPPLYEPMDGAESVRRPIASGVQASAAHLYPGHVLAPVEPTTVTTILGSCVSVCLWDAARLVGGINHFLLPDSPVGDRFSGRFAAVACRRLLAAFLDAGSDRRDLRAKVFGGACVIGALGALEGAAGHLGQRNVEAAFAFLDAERIPVVAQDVGGRLGRKVVYMTATGDAWVRAIHHHGGARGR